jgi:hypothetical protein
MRIILLVSILLLAGCASVPDDTSAIAASIVPIDQTRLEVKKDLKFLPSLSGLYFPAGIYLPVVKDGSGVFYQSPKGIKSIGVANAYYPVGGIYRFRRDDGSYGLKSWQNQPKLSWSSSRNLYDMLGANFSVEVVFYP